MHRNGTCLIALLCALLAGNAQAADLRVEVAGLRSAEGNLLVAVCPPETFGRRGCPYVAAAPASSGGATVRGIPPGTWGVQAIHDEDGNGKLTRRGFIPSEGMAFSRDAPMRRGPPRFADAALNLTGDGTITITMRYFQ